MKKFRQRRALPAEPVTVNIEKLNHEGRGIGRHQGKVVFVEQALPGETVEAKLTFRRSAYEEATALSVSNASADRIEPPCEYAGVCGGCSLQHMETGAQLRFKESVLHELLEQALGHSKYEQLPALTGPVSGYRRKARLGVRHVVKKNEVLIGFREKHSNFITHMKSCVVLDKDVSILLPELSSLIKGLNAFRVIPQIEVACGDVESGGQRVALVIRHLAVLTESDKTALSAFAEKHNIAMYLQPGGMETIAPLWPQPCDERLYYQLPGFGLKIGFHPSDFTQVNADINRAMLHKALEMLELEQHDTVLDLFCGLGNFTLPLATRCKHVTGIEGTQSLVDRGYENASRNKLENVSFGCADLFKPIKGDWLNMPFSKVLLDPPRSGAQEILPLIADKKPERIVYVSCNPATLARDAAILAGLGYRLASAGVMDMFPHTTHVESIALFLPGKAS